MFNPLNEFPHTIELGSREVVGEYPREQERFKSEKTIQGFMDTPTSSGQDRKSTRLNSSHSRASRMPSSA